jgi:hypothetical protein
MSGPSAIVVARLWAWAVALRPLKHVLPLGTLVRWARARPATPRSPEFERALEAFMVGGGRFPRRAPGNCLERSLAAYRVLCERGARPEIAVGVRRGSPLGIEGHVWLNVDGRPFAEAPGALDGYVTVVRYDAQARARVEGGGSLDLSGVKLA